MTEQENTSQPKTGSKPAAGPGSRGPMSGAMPMGKAKNMRGTLGRLLKILVEDKLRATLLVLFLIAAAGLSAISPKLLGNATNVLFDGLISKQVTHTVECSLPEGTNLDDIKPLVNDTNGNLDVDKLMNLPQTMQDQAAAPGAAAGVQSRMAPGVAGADVNANSDAPQTRTAPTDAATRPGCGEQSANSEDEFNQTSNLDSVKQMLSQMTITLGGSVDFSKFAFMLLFVILSYLFSFFTRWIAGWISVRLIAVASQKLRQQIEEKLWRLPLSYYDKTSRGEIMSRTTNDLDNVSQTLNQTGGDLLFMILMVVGVIGMMFSVSLMLTLITLATIPFFFGAIFFIMSKAQPQFKAQWAKTGTLNAHVEESFSGHGLIRSYGKQAQFEEKFNAENEALYKSSFKAQFISSIIMPAMGFFTNVNYVIIAFVGALRILSGNLTLGDLQAFIQYSRQYSQPLGQISSMMNMLQSGAASAERIFEILDAEEEEVQEFERELPLNHDRKIDGRIEFKNVNFSYNPQVKLIEDMNLAVTPGQSVAIVGPTGAGKTTLVNLIMRFYEVDSGIIELDGVNTRELSRQNLRKNIGMVLQDTWLFHGTIEENLKYGLPEGKTITDEEFYAATKATYVDHFVRSLPDGYQTVLDDEGSAISVGEKQLLTIARAFLADPDILILDEATSSVDTRTEVLVQKAMNALKSNRTSFVIAHRLSTIRDADTILVMEHGSIVEQGNHNELINKAGRYAALYQSQFEDEPEENEEVAR
jgi:ATP-binding cassette subfamily B protein